MTATASEFLANLEDCLGNPRRLAPTVPAFKLVPPDHDWYGGKGTLQVNSTYTLHHPKTNKTLACVLIMPLNHDNSLCIQNIHSYKRGYGREVVRRLAYFAMEQGLNGLETSGFTKTGSSFWFSMGFRGKSSLDYVRWPRGPFSVWRSARWQRRLAEDRDAVWDLAQTRFGRKVLSGHGGLGVLDFNDAKQRNYALKRLRLAEPA